MIVLCAISRRPSGRCETDRHAENHGRSCTWSKIARPCPPVRCKGGRHARHHGPRAQWRSVTFRGHTYSDRGALSCEGHRGAKIESRLVRKAAVVIERVHVCVPRTIEPLYATSLLASLPHIGCVSDARLKCAGSAACKLASSTLGPPAATSISRGSASPVSLASTASLA